MEGKPDDGFPREAVMAGTIRTGRQDAFRA